MGKYNTVNIRIRKSLRDELKLRFPETRDADLIQVMWSTSALRLEGGIRKYVWDETKKKKTG